MLYEVITPECKANKYVPKGFKQIIAINIVLAINKKVPVFLRLALLVCKKKFLQYFTNQSGCLRGGLCGRPHTPSQKNHSFLTF